ncbi:MAG: ATP-binding protein [Melioribacteraceae bacterium]|nr:ATP-binding protein [Melioribacteraceae bacterium]
MSNKNFVKIFKSDAELLPEIEDYILEILKPLKLKSELTNNIELAIAEGAANSILHGNKNNPKKNVTIKVILNSSTINISFSDEGKGFRPNEVPDPTKPENLLKGSGRGVHIMKSLVDSLEYKFSTKGTELILTFKY